MRKRSLLLTLATLAVLHLPATAQDADQPTITDELVVQERSVVLHVGGSEEPDPGSIRLQVGKTDQTVARLERIDPKSQAWNIVIWVDRQLVSPTAIAASAAALGQRSAELCNLGFVTLVVADPQPRTILSATRKVADLDRALAGLAGIQRQTRGEGAWSPPDNQVSIDRLSAFPEELALYSSDSPQVVFFLGAESEASDQDLESLAMHAYEDATPWAQRVRDLARDLALRRWITIGLVFRPAPVDRSVAPDPLAEFREQATGETLFFVNLLEVVSAKGSKSKMVNEESFETFILPRLAPVLMVARETGGSVITQESQVDLALEELRASWRLWFRVNDAALEGVQKLDIRPVSEQGLSLRAPRWIRLGGTD